MKTFILATLMMTSSAVTQASDIFLSEKIHKPLKTKIESDLAILDNLNMPAPHPRTLEIMGLTTLNASTVSKWLSERVKYIIEEDALSVMKLLFKRTVYVQQKRVVYPFGNVLPYSIDPNNKKSKIPEDQDLITSEQSGSVTVMSNMSASLYINGKLSNTLYGMNVSRGFLKKQINITIDSPRSGVIQIGEGLFHKYLTVNNDNENAVANSLKRLATFFHEARHSDGNGPSLSFGHAKCPTTHDYEGEYACDENLNGPYAIGTFMTIELIKSCDSECTEMEKEVLKLTALDSAGRILKMTKKGTPATDWDPSPESL